MSEKRKPADERRCEADSDEQDDAIIGVALRWSLAVLVGLVVVVASFVYAVTRPAPDPPVLKTALADVQRRVSEEMEIPRVKFTNITSAAGITFKHVNGAYGQKLLPETMGSGCAFFDFDGDGDQDLLLVNAQLWPWAPDPDPDAAAATTSLYANDGQGQFTDVSAGSGLDVSLYATGVGVGDYDNDGLADIYLAAVGTNRLFHNEGNGQFLDVTVQAGVAGGASDWSSSCGWFDYDRDGDLDLFVGNYVEWTRQYDVAQDFQLTGGGRAYGRPQNFGGSFPLLFRNDGHGKFADVTESAGLQVRNRDTGVPMGKSLGLTFADFDQDGWIDILVANDTVQNFLFRNQGNGTFQESALMAGVAFDMDGNARGGMGIDAALFRNDNTLGIAIGNFANEMTALYVADRGNPNFVDEAIATGLGPNTRLELTFGVFYFDCDLDGRLDLLAANGHLETDINRVQSSQFYQQSPQLFWNCGRQADTEFVPLQAEHCGTDLLTKIVGRGSSYADIDGDGDLDILVTTVGGTPRLLRNDQRLGHHWLRVQLEGKRCNRDAIGSWIAVELEDETLMRQVMPTRSYLSQVELPVTFGLGSESRVRSVKVFWADGSSQELTDVPLDTTLHVVQAVRAL